MTARSSMVSVLVALLALAVGWGAGALRPDTRPPLTSALDVLPARTNVVGFTDWKQIRATLGLGTVDTADERDELANESASRDLASRSVLGGAIEEMHAALGWSPADLEWEVFGQDPRGSAAVAQLEGSVSFDDVRARLRKAGYQQDGHVWTATRLAELPGILVQVALVPRQRLVVMSDSRGQIPMVLDAIAGRARSLASNHAAAATAEALAGNDSAILQGGTLGCRTTALAGAAAQQQARAAVDRAGRLETYRYSGRALVDHRGSGFTAQRVVFAMTFASAPVASVQARVRARLAAGPFIGRLGQTDETLRLRSSTADGPTVRMAFAHDPDSYAFMTGTGPVLFATCEDTA